MAKGAADAGYHPVGRGHRRQHLPALRRDAADGRRRRPTPPMTLHHPRQQDGGDDRRRSRPSGPRPQLEAVVRGLGVPPDHLHVVEAHPQADGREHRDPAARGRPPRACRSSSPCASASRPPSAASRKDVRGRGQE
ncbi:MAG: hypothetical protein M0C28_16455 [Candidatus Moduliflexus flocculans]|nr:hypothetical protein [Candidatus Moduliflexus flocculans]